jgi:glycosyltransferase involved in cell wall biosynthesis
MTLHVNPLVSFVVLCYNHEAFVRDCLQSILNQTGDHSFEIIFVDDASTDGSREVAHSFKDPRIQFIFHEKNQGHIATVHDGLRAARGEFLVRVDSDDRYRPHFLTEMLGVFEKNPGLVAAFGNIALMDERGLISEEGPNSELGSEPWKGNVLTRLLEKNFICSPTFIARRDAWLKTLPVTEGLAFHDWYFTTAIAREHEFYYTPEVVADYRVHPGNMHLHNTRAKVEEPSIFRLLDQIYSQPEKTAELENQKQRSKRQVYGAHYLDMAEKYFGCGYSADARRCYFSAIRRNPGYLFDFGIARRFCASIAGRRAYEYIKPRLKFSLNS